MNPLWRRLFEKWQTRKHGDQSGRWTHPLIPELTTWLNRKHGKVGFYLAQALSGHGCFNAYLKRFKKRDDASCSYCGSLVDNAEHTLFFCARWGVAREAVGREVGAQLIPETMVSLILQSEQKWILIESASIGGGIFLFLPWLAQLVGLPNGHVAADESPRRTDDESVVRDFKLESTAREV